MADEPTGALPAVRSALGASFGAPHRLRLLAAVCVVVLVVGWATGRPLLGLAAAAFGAALGVLLWCEARARRLRGERERDQWSIAGLERRVRELGALYQAARAAQQASGPEEVLRSILRAALGLVDGADGSVALVRGDELRVVAAVGDGGGRGGRWRMKGDVAARAVARGRSASETDAAVAEGAGEPSPGPVSLSLTHQGRALGVLTLAPGPGRIVGKGDLEVLGELADQAAVVIVEAQRQEALQLEASQRLYHSQHDALTNLPSRNLFLHYLETWLLEGRRVGILLLDLDQFRRINESLGHAAGDAVLVEVAARLGRSVSAQGVAARLGSDQFALAEPDLADAAAMEGLAAQVRGALAAPARWEGRDVGVRARLGAALAGIHGRTAEELLRNADTALHVAKEHPESDLVLFTRSMRRDAVWRMDLETGLRTAIAEGQLELRYQPIVELASGDVVGYEALVRWRHPELGSLPPATWVAAAEESALCGRLDLWVLERACSATARMLEQLDGERLHGHVNISPGSLAIPGFAEQVRDVLERVGLPPSLVVLEITERGLVSDAPAVLENITILRALGIGLALDDFGTGYSALGYLRRFPVDGVKIDRMFIDAIVSDGDARALVQGIVRLSEGLGLDVVAEGIERQDQLAVLRELGCRYGQGWLFSRSLSEADFARVARAGADTLMLPSARPVAGEEDLVAGA